jgi:hypothetical protein
MARRSPSRRGATHRTCCTDAFGDTAKVHTSPFQLIYKGQEVAGVKSKPIQLPHHHLITLPQMVEELIELRPTRHRSKHSIIGEDPAATSCRQGCMLQIRVLLHSADPCVADTSRSNAPIAHQRRSSTLMRIAAVRHIAEKGREHEIHRRCWEPQTGRRTPPVVRSKDPVIGRRVCGRQHPSVYVYGTSPYIFTVRVKRPLLASLLARTTTPTTGER